MATQKMGKRKKERIGGDAGGREAPREKGETHDSAWSGNGWNLVENLRNGHKLMDRGEERGGGRERLACKADLKEKGLEGSEAAGTAEGLFDIAQPEKNSGRGGFETARREETEEKVPTTPLLGCGDGRGDGKSLRVSIARLWRKNSGAFWLAEQNSETEEKRRVGGKTRSNRENEEKNREKRNRPTAGPRNRGHVTRNSESGEELVLSTTRPEESEKKGGMPKRNSSSFPKVFRNRKSK